MYGIETVKHDSVFSESYGRALSTTIEGVSFFEEFYDNFTHLSEDVAAKFTNVNMVRQQQMLSTSINTMLNCYVEREISPEMHRIAVMHDRAHLDIRPELYDRWLECLIEAVKKFDVDFDEDVELAWRLVLSTGIAFMKFRHARPGSGSRSAQEMA